jgi:uncharacterized OB-fold protein
MRPIDSKLLQIEDEAAHKWSLPGNRCRDCGEVFHPPRYRCARCTSGNLEPVELARTGTVVSCTQVHQTHPESLVPAPYWVALISLDNGPTIEAVCPVSLEATPPGVGGRVQLVWYELETPAGEEQLVTYAFRGVNGSEG